MNKEKEEAKSQYRLGRKQKRAILDCKGKEVALFAKGQEEIANACVVMLNALSNINKANELNKL